MGGHSVGGALATVAALERPDVDGLIVFAPAWALRGFDVAMWAGTLADPFIDFVELEWEINPIEYETLATNVGDEEALCLDFLSPHLSRPLPLYNLPFVARETMAAR